MKHSNFAPFGNPWHVRVRNACRLFWAGLRDRIYLNIEANVGAHRFMFERVLFNPTVRVYLTADQLAIVFGAMHAGTVDYGDTTLTTEEIQAVIDKVTAAKPIANPNHISDEVIDQIIDTVEGR